MTAINTPGIYEAIPEAAYHADPCPAPSLSRSVLRLLVRRSESHAYIAHPKLGGLADTDPGGDEIADYGSAAHAAFLQGHSIIKRLDYPDWRTNAAKAAREQAYADGCIPLLTKSHSRCMRLIEVLEDFRLKTGAFTHGKPEQTLAWQDGPTDGSVWCRARVDWLPDEPSAPPWDLKTTSGAAMLGPWSRIAFDGGYDLQDAFYGRGLEILRGEPPEPMKFCVVEQKPPFGISVFEFSAIARELADEDVRQGLRLWDKCLSANRFPSYPWDTQMVDPAPWVIRDRISRSLISPRNQDLLRGREHPNAVSYIETGNFGG